MRNEARPALNRTAAEQSALDELVAGARRRNASALARMSDPALSWVVVDSRTDGELLAHRHLGEYHHPAYCLLEPCRRAPDPRSRAKPTLTARPSIPGMLFVGLRDPAREAPVLFRRGVVTSTDDRPGHLLVVPGADLRAFIDRHDSKVIDVRALLQRFVVGARVTPNGGPFEGHVGAVTEIGRRDVGVDLPLFGRATVVRFPLDGIREVA